MPMIPDYKILGIWKLNKPWKLQLIEWMMAIGLFWGFPTLVAAMFIFALGRADTSGWRSQVALAVSAAKRGALWGLIVYGLVVCIGIVSFLVKRRRDANRDVKI